MPVASQPAASAEDDLELAADQAIAACSGDPGEAMKALLAANGFLEAQLDEVRSKVSTGYAQGRLPAARERKDEEDV